MLPSASDEPEPSTVQVSASRQAVNARDGGLVGRRGYGAAHRGPVRAAWLSVTVRVTE